MSRDLARFVMRRLYMSVVVLVAATVLIFFLIYLAPGSPEESLLRGITATPQAREALRERYGLDRPLYVQLLTYMRGVATGDFGRSYVTHEDVLGAILGRVGVTGPLIVLGFLMAVAAGTLVGIYAAYRRGGTIDRLIVASTVVGSSSPPFATALVLLYIFAIWLGWFPAIPSFGQTSSAPLSGLVLPSVTLALFGVAPMAKFTRVSVIDALGRDYVVFARARGVRRVRILTRYVIRNAMVGVSTVGGIILIAQVATVPLVEVPFNLDGVGSLLVTAITNQDLPLVQGIVILTTVVVLGINFAVDVLYALFDPRVRAKAVQS